MQKCRIMNSHQTYHHDFHLLQTFSRTVTASAKHVQCVQKKTETKVFFCNVFYKTRAILMKFGTPFPE